MKFFIVKSLPVESVTVYSLNSARPPGHRADMVGIADTSAANRSGPLRSAARWKLSADGGQDVRGCRYSICRVDMVSGL